MTVLYPRDTVVLNAVSRSTPHMVNHIGKLFTVAQLTQENRIVPMGQISGELAVEDCKLFQRAYQTFGVKLAQEHANDATLQFEIMGGSQPTRVVDKAQFEALAALPVANELMWRVVG